MKILLKKNRINVGGRPTTATFSYSSKKRQEKKDAPKKATYGNRIPIGFNKSLSTTRPWADSKALPVLGERATHLIKSCIPSGAFTRGRSKARSKSKDKIGAIS